MSSKFFQNRDCEHFPCHSSCPPEEFNCLFCYCPLYALGKRCGGKYVYLENGIKDCSGCDFPHHRNNYEALLRRYEEIIALVRREDDRT